MGHATLPLRRALIAAMLSTPSIASAQIQRDQAAHARFLALNVVIGATASTARAMVAGAPLRIAIAKGLFGGSLMSGGMELIGTQSRSLRFAGLQLTAVGASVARNADARAPLFSDLTLPVYPLYLRIRASSDAPITARLSMMSAVRLVSAMTTRDGTRVDWAETFATGAPVLRSPQWRLPSASCPHPCEGAFAQHNAGIVIYSASAGTDYDLERTLAHESLHLAQQTRDAILDAIPASDAALVRAGQAGRFASRFFVLDAIMPLRLIDEGEVRMRGATRRNSWYETEARAFAPGGEIRP